jgi:hypothetical protein
LEAEHHGVVPPTSASPGPRMTPMTPANFFPDKPKP